MNTRAFALVNDLTLALPAYEQARAEFQRVRATGTEAEREAALGEVIVRVHDVLETIKRHEGALT